MDPFSASQVCRVLMADGLLSRVQVKQILEQKEVLLKRVQQKAASGVAGSTAPSTVIDVLMSLRLKRSDDPSRVLDEEAVYQALAAHWQIPFKKIDPLKLDLNVVTTTIPKSFALRHLVLPVSVRDNALTVAMANPFDVEAIEDIARASQLKVTPVVSPRSDIVRLIDEFFGFKRSIAAAEHQFAAPVVDLGNLEQFVRLRQSDELPSTDQHIVNAVEHLFSYAIDQRASDIHIEPKRDKTLVRMRIDGVLHTVYELPKTVHSAVISRIKNLSRLDMAEKRRAQDGRIKTAKGELEVEIRVSTVPVAFGEKVVCRIMDPDILFQDLEPLGFYATDLIRYNRFIHLPHGIVLVTGPTGSGKSTTLYSTLRSLATPEINVTTVEDPIEMVHEAFNQIAVQTAVGVNFASILRNVLRQDPDIIMVGEMRDRETAENAIQAALTGHLVLSTLHTNDAPSSITRLLELKIPAFLVRSTLVGIVAQRLVRRICPHCQESFSMEAEELVGMGLTIRAEGPLTLHRGKGCHRCRGTGYLGRVGIFEVLPCTEGIRACITEQTDPEALRARARREGMVTLRENAVRKLLDGVTTYQEVFRVTWEKL
jgi:general secretion pathway protein E